LLELSSLEIDDMADSVEGHLLDKIEEEDGGMEATIETGQWFGTAVSWGAMFEGNDITSLDAKEITNKLHILPEGRGGVNEESN
jgi:hypothetical protein